jgi:hypothetical protein
VKSNSGFRSFEIRLAAFAADLQPELARELRKRSHLPPEIRIERPHVRDVHDSRSFQPLIQ